MKVFLAATSLSTSYGGPAVSVSRLATALSKAGAEVGLWAADNSAICGSIVTADTTVRYFDGTESAALQRFGIPDVLHDNGIWLPHNHRLAVLAHKCRIPRVVSLRGMLEPWAMRHKRFKKLIAWPLYQRRDLMSACRHVASSDVEAANIRSCGLGVPVVTVPNGVDIPELQSTATADRTAAGGPKTALFLGRIYPVKGLPMLVEAWARVRPRDWVLKIAGPDEAGHRAEVEGAIARFGLNNVISFLGPVQDAMKQSAFMQADLFVLPTYSESFGMAVVEALAHGLPVLTTKGAPWSVVRENGCGWWVDITVQGLVEALQQATILDRQTLQAMGAKGRELVRATYAWDRVAAYMCSVYADCIANGNGRYPRENYEATERLRAWKSGSRSTADASAADYGKSAPTKPE